MNVLHHDLETVKELGFRVLHFRNKVFGEVFVHDAIRCGKEGENVFDEIALVIIEFVIPVHEVSGKINFFCSPKARFRLFVETPDVIVFDREEDEPVGIVFENGFGYHRVLWKNLFNGRLDFSGFDLVFGCLVHFSTVFFAAKRRRFFSSRASSLVFSGWHSSNSMSFPIDSCAAFRGSNPRP